MFSVYADSQDATVYVFEHLKDIWLGAKVFVEGQEPPDAECGHRLAKTGAMAQYDIFAPIR